MNNDLVALYRLICDRPDDDVPRLVYADLVEEAGDPARAAFIRDQIALARVPSYDPLAVRIRFANPDAVYAWCRTDDLPQGLPGLSWSRFQFRRGFPWLAAVDSVPALVVAGDRVFRAAPLQAFDLSGTSPVDIRWLVDWPHLVRVRYLRFRQTRLLSVSLTRLGRSPRARGLVGLGIEQTILTGMALSALVRSPLFSRLTTFELQNTPMPPARLVSGLAAAVPGSLTRLVLSGLLLPATEAPHLFALPVLRGLSELDLSDNPLLGVAGLLALADSGILGSLSVLSLRRNRLSLAGMRALTSAGGACSLRSLDLSDNLLGPTAVAVLTRSGWAAGLRSLNLSGNPIGDRGAAELADCPALADLLELDLSCTGLTERGARSLAQSPYLGRLLALRLEGNPAPARSLGRDVRRVLVDRFGPHVRLDPVGVSG